MTDSACFFLREFTCMGLSLCTLFPPTFVGLKKRKEGILVQRAGFCTIPSETGVLGIFFSPKYGSERVDGGRAGGRGRGAEGAG